MSVTKIEEESDDSQGEDSQDSSGLSQAIQYGNATGMYGQSQDSTAWLLETNFFFLKEFLCEWLANSYNL